MCPPWYSSEGGGKGFGTHEFVVALDALQYQPRAPGAHQLPPRRLLPLRAAIAPTRRLHRKVRRPVDARALGIADVRDVVDVLEAILLAPDDLLFSVCFLVLSQVSTKV